MNVMPLIFVNDEEGYQKWLADHPSGHVVNARRNLTSSYMVLHTARCRSISRYSGFAPEGAFTERAYLKICSDDLGELRNWLKNHDRPDGSFSKICSLCHRVPLSEE